MSDEFWDKREAAQFLGVSRATFDRYVVRFKIQKFGVPGGRRVLFRAANVRNLIHPLQDYALPKLDVEVPSTSPATAPESSMHFARRQRGRASGQLVLPASAQGEHALFASSLLGILALEAGALGAPSLMLAAAPLAAYLTIRACRRRPIVLLRTPVP